MRDTVVLDTDFLLCLLVALPSREGELHFERCGFVDAFLIDRACVVASVPSPVGP